MKPRSDGQTAKWVVMWTLPEGMDLEAWNDWYWNQHVPMAKKLPGLRRYTTTLVHRTVLGAPLYRMAEQYFDDVEALEAAVNSEIGAAVADDAGPWVTDLSLYVTLEQEEGLSLG
ncbi:MAG: EthD family reductase [Solirubrobacteraceae bacterium]